MSDSKRTQTSLTGLIMGYPLDQLLDATIEIAKPSKPSHRRPGIKLPSGEDPGTGNIIICGPPGSGKSTLGLQMAVSCAKTEENGSVAAYISLESTMGEIKAKARDYGWIEKLDEKGRPRDWLLEAGQLSGADEFLTPADLAAKLAALLSGPPDDPAYVPSPEAADAGMRLPNPVEPTVLVSVLTPRDILGGPDEAEEVFWRRYTQVECLLIAAEELERESCTDRRELELGSRNDPAAMSLLARASVALARQIVEEARVQSGGASAEDSQATSASGQSEPGTGESLEMAFYEARSCARTAKGLPDSEAVRSARKVPIRVPELDDDTCRWILQLVTSASQISKAIKRRLEPAAPTHQAVHEAARAIEDLWGKAGASHREAPSERPRFREECLEEIERAIEETIKTLPPVSNARAILPLVVIDSLNMLGPADLTRNHIYQLFQLFKRYRRIGVFIVETGDGEMPFDATLADVVIRLSATKDNGYAVRHLEVEKSRYSACVRGLHPFKSVTNSNATTPELPRRDPIGESEGRKEPARCGIVIFPSLHHVSLKTDPTLTPDMPGHDHLEPATEKPFEECFGLNGLKSVLPGGVLRGTPSPYLRGKVVMIRGGRGTFKTSMAMSFLAEGLLSRESVMLIRLSDNPLIERPPLVRAQTEGQWRGDLPLLTSEIAKRFDWGDLTIADDSSHWQNIAPPSKVVIRKLNYGSSQCEPNWPAFFEADFKGGYILPEELVQFVSDMLIRRDGENGRIRRVVFSDVGQIGVNYPFLRSSLTSGDLFLPTFVHLMRNYGVDLVMVGTMSNVPDADAAVNKGATLSDAVVTSRMIDVFGKGQVVLSGGQAWDPEGTKVLPVVRRTTVTLDKESAGDEGERPSPKAVSGFELDTSYLEGLVGLDTPNPHRPGLVLHVFEDEAPQAEYNWEMEGMLRAGLARPRGPAHDKRRGPEPSESEAADVWVQRFGADMSEATHDSLDILLNRPVNRTVLYTVDEFSSDSEEARTFFLPLKTDPDKLNPAALKYPPRSDIYAWPYYCNVLLIAYRQTRLQPSGSPKPDFWQPQTWTDVRKAISGKTSFWYDRTAKETLACMFLDALLSGQPKETLPSSDPEDRKKFLNNLLADLGSRQLTGDEAGEIAALGHLLGQANAYPLDNNKVGRIGKPDRPHLVENADVYVCWYSQLRELIDRKPELASDLRVCALPGRGFRGDWYIGILRGSVSPLLGQEVIEKLCRLDEEHKRFSRGVGLPVSKRFLAPGSNYFAWPIGGESQRSPAAVPLSRVFRIHGQAWLRSDIDQYKKIRSTLAAGAQQLAELSALASANEQEARDLVKKVVGARMFRQILMLSPELRERARALARPGERRAQEHEAGPALGAPDR